MTEKSELFYFEELYHDLKTPMSILFAYIQLLERTGSMPSQAIHYVQEAKKNCYRMAKLVWDANDGARLSKGLLLPKFINGDLVTLVKNICYEARVLTDPNHIRIRFISRVDAICMALDRQIMERILLNLLSNAKQYSYESSVINVTVWENAGFAHISVRDYGPGVPEEMARRIFSRNVSGSEGGVHSGLGLFIVNELTALLGGEVRLTETSPGTEIVIRLPVFFTDATGNDLPVDDFFYDNMVQMELAL